MSKCKLYLDIDQTLIDTTAILLTCYENITKEKPITKEDLTWNIKMAYPNYDKDIIHKIFDSEMFFEVASYNIFPNAINIVHEIKEYYDIIFVSCGTKENLCLKDVWLKKHFDFYTENNFLPLLQDKKIFNKSLCKGSGNVILDDRIDCLLSSEVGLKLLYRNENKNYEWQVGYEELIKNNKIDMVITIWNNDLKKLLIEWCYYNNR